MVGEASIALATACFGDSVNGDSGHDQDDVLFIAFTGSGAVPGAGGAQWNAQDYNDFENSISTLGDSLVARIGNSSGGGSGGNGGGSSGGGGGSTSCSWEGHCAGASCGSDDDCSDSLTCSNGVCGGGSSSGGSPGGNGGGSSGGGGGSSSCAWEGHCFGAPCGSDDDCSDPWECVNGSCGN